MQTVILAAGDGTRLNPLTDATPKPLLPVGPGSLLAETARTAVEAGASALYIAVPPDYRRFHDELGDTIDGVPVTFAVQPRPVGTADAVQRATKYFDGPFAVLPGDALLDRASIRTLFERAPAVGVDPESEPVTTAVGDGGQPDAMHRSREWNLPGRPTGACALPAPAHDRLEVGICETGEREFADVLSRLVGEVDMEPVEHRYVVDVDRPWDLLSAAEVGLETWAAETREPPHAGTVSERARLTGAVRVATGARVGDGVVVDGPVIIDAGTTVAPNAIIRGPSYIGPDVEIGHAAEVTRSVLQRGSSVGHAAFVADSIVGANASLAPGTTVANRRHDGETVVARAGQERVPTGRAAFGAVVGPRVSTGIDTSIDAGVTLSTGSHTEPDECVLTDR
ncbi:sugar phosphate nucleotidyltransferase [Haloarchaeobius litoreus]|uniref:Bifunctional protein GlmU n=1 Tax=Haloarchaeobius litoreus TaxID=755306 RepID=A0ABD6DP36_9EURY|nr:sugar phosphate nucleotidyltransferase [Haloarchaeobius litoreus]